MLDDIEQVAFNFLNLHWKKHDLNVLYDGTHPCSGQRYHVVSEDIEPSNIDNAVVLSLETFTTLELYRQVT